MIGKAARGRFIPYFSGGRCAVHVDDVVEGILAAAAVEEGVRGNRYILGGENVSYRQIAMRSANALHLQPVLDAGAFLGCRDSEKRRHPDRP